MYAPPGECSSVYKKSRISKVGNAHLRRALYMPALVAIRHQPHLRAFYQHLRAQVKPKMVALIAVMRKLRHGIYGMFKHQQPLMAPSSIASPILTFPQRRPRETSKEKRFLHLQKRNLP